MVDLSSKLGHLVTRSTFDFSESKHYVKQCGGYGYWGTVGLGWDIGGGARRCRAAGEIRDIDGVGQIFDFGFLTTVGIRIRPHVIKVLNLGSLCYICLEGVWE